MTKNKAQEEMENNLDHSNKQEISALSMGIC
jgi:hypothetical protein